MSDSPRIKQYANDRISSDTNSYFFQVWRDNIISLITHTKKFETFSRYKDQRQPSDQGASLEFQIVFQLAAVGVLT